jgi:hypothetical protein
VLGGLGDTETTPGKSRQADSESEAAAPQGPKRTDELVAQDGKLDERRAQDRVVGILAAAEHEPQDRDEEQQQREYRHERAVGERRGESATAVVTELADHRHHKRQRCMTLLVLVNGPDRPLERVHPATPVA